MHQAPNPNLGELQQLVMLAVARLGDRAFGAAIRDELDQVAGRSMAIGTVYVTLVRLEERGLVRSRRDAGGQRAGRPRRLFELTPFAWRALEASRRSFDRMWRGLETAAS